MEPARGVCVITVEQQAAAVCLISVSTLLDVTEPHEESRRHFLTQREALADVQRFLRDMAAAE
jgi:hypothetical protein